MVPHDTPPRGTVLGCRERRKEKGLLASMQSEKFESEL